MEPRPSPKARCVHCRTEVSVLDSYTHGDHIKCPECGTRHKVHRGDVVRLVLADVAPLQEALRANQQLVLRLEEDLRSVRMSLGWGANGLIVGVVYLLWQLIARQRTLGTDVALEALGVALGAAVVLELMNFLFMTKRQAIRRLTDELEEARRAGRQIQQKIREAGR